jgi:hypothetical protein
MTKPQNSGRVIGFDFEKRPAKKRLLSYSKDSFPIYAIWIREFFMIHNTIYQYIGDSLENFYNILDEKFFEWLNQPKNYSKFMFEIKKEFMDMADDILIREIMVRKLKNPVLIDLPDLEEIHIPRVNISEEIEHYYDIDEFSEPEESYVSQLNISESESESDSSTCDDNYYSSFFS